VHRATSGPSTQRLTAVHPAAPYTHPEVAILSAAHRGRRTIRIARTPALLMSLSLTRNSCVSPPPPRAPASVLPNTSRKYTQGSSLRLVLEVSAGWVSPSSRGL
jgi:hypothetical protein